MDTVMLNRNLLGINGLGRIGKLNLWNQLMLGHFDGYVVNCGREVGKNLDDLIHVIETDSTYGSLHKFLYGMSGKKAEIKVLDAETPIISIDGKPIKILRKARNPKDINWAGDGIRIVVDCTGTFTDPGAAADSPKGSVRGHLEAGAQKVIVSAPFKFKDPTRKSSDDATTLIYGINHSKFDPRNDQIISAASCTTTGLAHMMLPLFEHHATQQIVTASMSTIHATTNTQSILDSVPSAGASDLRKNRSVLNNIILSTTGAAKTLEQVMPQISKIGFMADSVRVPTSTVSLIILNITFHSQLDKNGEPTVSRAFLNRIYKEASEGSQKDLLIYSERQNVSADLIGSMAACTLEAHETHTRTGFLTLSREVLAASGVSLEDDISLPVTHAKIFGWYDNELGSYVNCLSRLTKYVDQQLI